MTTSEALSSLEVALGGICSAPKVLTGGRLLELSVSGEIFEKLLRHWQVLSEGSRPRLRGLSLSRETPEQRQLILEIGKHVPFLLITVDARWAARTLTGIWPYAAWWEEELASLGGAAPAAAGIRAEVSWLRG